MRLIVAITAAVWMLAISQYSSAGLMCDERYAFNVNPAIGCELGSTNNDSQVQVNLDLMFGYDDWTLDGKSDTSLPSYLEYFNQYESTADWTYGEFGLTEPAFDMGDFGFEIMFVQKDGAGDPDTYVGWLLDPFATAFEFDSPFLNVSADATKNISHTSWYSRLLSDPEDPGCDPGDPECPGEVPEPTPLALMGLGLLALRRSIRKRQIA